MPRKQGKRKPGAKRLAKGVRSDKGRAGTGRARKNNVRAQPRGDTGRTLGDERELSPLARLMGALKKEKIRSTLRLKLVLELAHEALHRP